MGKNKQGSSLSRTTPPPCQRGTDPIATSGAALLPLLAESPSHCSPRSPLFSRTCFVNPNRCASLIVAQVWDHWRLPPGASPHQARRPPTLSVPPVLCVAYHRHSCIPHHQLRLGPLHPHSDLYQRRARPSGPVVQLRTPSNSRQSEIGKRSLRHVS